MTAEQTPPLGWGGDDLTDFLGRVRHNQEVTFARNPVVTGKLIPIDELFARVSRDWLNPQQSLLSVNLFFRCHMAFRAACGLAMAGQAAETFVMCRSVIEYAAYAVHIVRNEGLGQIWLDRHKSPAAMRVLRKKFAHQSVVDSVRKGNRDAAGMYENLYELTIDFGAHPNERAVRTNMRSTVLADLDVERTISSSRAARTRGSMLSFTGGGLCSLELLHGIHDAAPDRLAAITSTEC